MKKRTLKTGLRSLNEKKAIKKLNGWTEEDYNFYKKLGKLNKLVELSNAIEQIQYKELSPKEKL